MNNMFPRLCRTCQDIFQGECPHKLKDANHHLYLYQLQQSASEDCFVCVVLWRAVSENLPPVPPQEAAEVGTHTSPETSAEKPVSKYRLSHKSSPSLANPYNLSELTFVVDKNGVVHGGSSYTLCLQPLATSNLDKSETVAESWEASFDIASTWLHKCLQSYSKCCKTLEMDRVNPTRLLKIAQDGSNTIKLTLDTSKEPILQYATVSHCWGTSQVWRLAADTLHLLRNGLSIAELGQTFQDVIYATKSLGLRYIWIDSLCIFQDSKADWEHEAPRMSDVYRNSIVNIAASAAANNQAGCFQASSRSGISPCYVQSDWSDCDKNNSFHMYYDRLWPMAFESMPLMTRAWVVQELLLAPRVLHITDKQLYWQCYDLTACESYPRGTPPNLLPEEVPRDILCYVLHHVTPESKHGYSNPTSDPLREVQRLWKGILERYTRCNLTYTSDKLAALAGLAKVMNQTFNGQYCAGMWKNHMVTQLSWSPNSEQPLFPSTPRPSPYRAPSWSWACLDGPISMAWFQDDFPAKIDLIDVLECVATNDSGDSTSAVTGGHLRLSGWLSTIQLSTDEENNCFSVYINGHWVERTLGCFISLDCQLPSMKLHCLPLFVDTHLMPQWNMSLLLLHQTGDIKGQFRRYGSMHLFAGDLDVANWSDFKSLTNDSWLEYEAIGRDGMQTLTII